ncbi:MULTISPECIES: autotransporter outer membrane beta-barrel domain-containing protein [Pseudomonas]|uniref:autotransporter outer membrane beta-barrel domain-containing protein n=1 Tax=Pseudomonas TaxID=286 RepID=UPI00191DF195|nr:MULTISPECIES: autotransporter outer membrane beta-barrel domain-containing protein [Pseudomonas]MBL0796437.1 autotransporter outer membrane beta-barrel domain-containing protein [Pseudomonas sp. B7]MBX8621255.1 autotransporter outer membrane beta-barrel domain-containing protein [Pseudomonas glycinae]
MQRKISNVRLRDIRWGLVLSSFLAPFSQIAIGGNLIGGTTTITGGTPEDWTLSSNATLNVNGADTLFINTDASVLNVNSGNTQQIAARNGSQVNLSGANVSGASGLAAVTLVNSDGSIKNSTINGNRVGLQVVRDASTLTGSTATVSGKSVITGVTGGALVSAFSRLDIVDSTLQATGASSYGVRLASGQATATDSTIIGGQNGVIIGLDGNSVQPATLTLTKTTVEGVTGSAILVDFANAGSSRATITLDNANLLAGNGTILDVRGGATASMTVNNSTLNGNVINEAGSTAELVLQNNSALTGRLENVSHATINDTSRWVLVGDGQIENLTLNGGTVRFGADNAFYQLNVGQLAGTGHFELGTDFATGQTDLLNVTGTATGRHELAISSSGVDPAAGQPIRVVQTAGGDAEFFINHPVDLGTYSYGLEKNGNDWVLDPTTKTVSPGTRSVLALFKTAPTVWYGELASLHSRMGELRFNGGQGGAWGRTYGNKYNVADASGVGYQQTQQGFTLGADTPLPFGDGQWLIGVMAGHSKSDLNLDGGTSGTVTSNYLGTYLTWIDPLSGYYVDAVLKVNRFRNDAKVGLSDGGRAKGDYDNTGLGGSVELGRRIKLEDGVFIEPYTKWSGVVIEGKHFSLDNDMQADGDRTRSLLGEAGMTVGRTFALERDLKVQPYARVAMAHEFAKNNEVKVNNNEFNNDLSGSRGELAVGVAIAMTDRLQVHFDADYSNGKNIERPIGLNIGARYNF